MNKLKLATGIVLIFALGLFTGALGSGFYFKYRIKRFRDLGPVGKKEYILKKLTRRLDLTPKQQGEIAIIYDEMKEQLIAFRKKHQPDLKQIREQGQARIKEKLDEEQKEEFDEMMEELRRRHGSREQRWRWPSKER